MSNDKKQAPGVLIGGIYFLGDEIGTQLCGDYFITHEIRIHPVIKQPVFQWKVSGRVFFDRGSVELGSNVKWRLFTTGMTRKTVIL